jgi:hypothetical protein
MVSKNDWNHEDARYKIVVWDMPHAGRPGCRFLRMTLALHSIHSFRSTTRLGPFLPRSSFRHRIILMYSHCASSQSPILGTVGDLGCHHLQTSTLLWMTADSGALASAFCYITRTPWLFGGLSSDILHYILHLLTYQQNGTSGGSILQYGSFMQ